MPPPPSNDPPIEPAVEAPAKPPLSDEEDVIEDEQLDEAHYDSLEKASTPPGEYWAVPATLTHTELHSNNI